jgi:2-polyprenyl-3-methyl-5-hydroxy-6-metoxy-1,4-benzoquinol methylase
MKGRLVLDAGCGEGKNSAFLAGQGASVRAIDVSSYALANARRAWPTESITWEQGDIASIELIERSLDIVVCYGLYHCLPDVATVRSAVSKLKAATRPNGFHVVCAFNSRLQELDRAHPEFAPLLEPHAFYLELYKDWEILEHSDEDLVEQHPHNEISHRHSMTRLIVRAP